MDGNAFATTVFVAFNVLSITGAVVCARRSYTRHRRPARALMAGIGGLFIVPLALVVCVALARPQGTSRSF
ncbi:hypothetical protein [Rhodococcus koreensis]|uniref:Uncharacterized protein n=1 Tax=Rhodococcus koreensis TaxID=99653 RepID=A0A1H4I622_9NOCA|nr:hypothetical protein [Rhodococcus koreensis]SEB29360.1 hypothetical protein SAMN04490239_0078 [Rhodococcus koreensis]